MFDIKGKTILVLAPHTDDGELGAGSTVAKLSKNNKVHQISFSNIDDNRLVIENQKAADILGYYDLHQCNYKVRRFDRFRQKILDDLIYFRKKYNPEMIFLPSKNDIHQDHQVINQEGIRAFRSETIIGYSLNWNLMVNSHQVFSVISKKHLNKKIQACNAYKSQAGRIYMNSEVIKAMAVNNGSQINEEYAELFECIRLKIKN